MLLNLLFVVLEIKTAFSFLLLLQITAYLWDYELRVWLQRVKLTRPCCLSCDRLATWSHLLGLPCEVSLRGRPSSGLPHALNIIIATNILRAYYAPRIVPFTGLIFIIFTTTL